VHTRRVIARLANAAPDGTARRVRDADRIQFRLATLRGSAGSIEQDPRYLLASVHRVADVRFRRRLRWYSTIALTVRPT